MPLNREPWLAALLSIVIPGSGLAYAGKRLSGLLIFTLETALLVIGIHQIISDQGNTTVGLMLLVIEPLIRLATAVMAFQIARNANTSAQENHRLNYKDPWLAVLLSTVIPGSGLLYLKQFRAFIVALISFLLVCFVIGLLAIDYPHPLLQRLLVLPLVLFFGALDFASYRLAPRDRRQPGAVKIICASVIVQIIFFVCSAALREYVVEPFAISGRSMRPTFMPDDRIFVWKWSQPDLHRGQIIAFKEPGSNVIYVKRVAAYGGESVEIRDQQLYINEKPIHSSALSTVKYSQDGFNGVRGNSHYVERGSIFVLGDDSELSKDSRFFGNVPLRNIVGYPYKIWWPVMRIQKLELQ